MSERAIAGAVLEISYDKVAASLGIPRGYQIVSVADALPPTDRTPRPDSLLVLVRGPGIERPEEGKGYPRVSVEELHRLSREEGGEE